ncbi:carboxypeptidase-like regulatory domain-containing protein [Mucilaginibacter angelicae]|uniref:Carboxypeptidase-like regulatory domain-containing protein n=1 Tax=Mucilaginibacter angelicae TaxID=869718 RepID=A0ABV6LAB9_9SPHI
MQATLKRSLLFFSFLSFCINAAFAQKPLTPSRQSSYYTYIYKMPAEDVLKFYLYPNKSPDEKMLHNPVDSFKTDSRWENTLPMGNYLKVCAQKNRINYTLIENHSAYLQLLKNNYDTRFIITDAAGNKINGARVTIKNKQVPFDDKTGSYFTKIKSSGLVTVDYNNVINYYRLTSNFRGRSFLNARWFSYHWYKLKNLFSKTDDNANYYKYQRRLEENSKYTGFIVFNKPIYKPLDTVKFKAFIISKKSKKPITNHHLIVRLQDGPRDNGKVIGYTDSYRDGAFEYKLVLADSLKLSLDDEYYISLEASSAIKYDLDKYHGDDEDEKFLSNREVYIAGKFGYEEYELKTITFKTRTDKKIHEPGNPLSLYLKATDENDLPVQDARFQIKLLSRQVELYKAANVFIPDTLWQYKGTLEPLGETKVVIPDSIFPKANFRYYIQTDLLTSDNEHHTSTEYLSYQYNNYKIKYSLSADTLKINGLIKGKDTPMSATLAAINSQSDTISRQKIKLPANVIVNPALRSYEVKTDSISENVNLSNLNSDLNFAGAQTADSLIVKVNNPRKLHFWYWLIGNNALLDAGEADSLFYKKRWTDKRPVVFAISYVWGGETRISGITVPYQEKLLTINVKQPLAVYPGQQVKTEIEVKDALGKPVPNTDITAWSLTRKFPNYSPPFVPYLGKSYPAAVSKPYAIINKPTTSGSMQLTWDKWSHDMGLDSIAYYQFTHPKTLYKIEEPAPDSVTQIAPFIVKDGDIVSTHILYIDERPVFFSQAQQLQRYSFKVTAGRHSLKFRTFNQSITIDSIEVQKGKKLIMSINADTMINKTARFKKMPDTLLTSESDLIDKYLIRVTNNFGLRMATLEQDGNIILLNPEPVISNTYNTNSEILAGPLPGNYTTIKVKGDEPQNFLVEPDYSYHFEPGLIKQKSIKTKYPFDKRTYAGNNFSDDYTQYALTNKETENIWQQYLDLRSQTTALFHNEAIDDEITGRLSIAISEKNGERPFVKNIIIYREGYPDFIRIYPGNTNEPGKLPVGKYRLFFLLKKDEYYVKNNISIKANGVNFYRADIIAQPKDSVSVKINDVITARTGINDYNDYNIQNDALKLKEAFNDKYIDKSGFKDMMFGQVIGAEDGLPAPGVTVRIKGTSTGTQTDINGRFAIKVPSSGKLIFSYIGYLAQEADIKPGASILIALLEQKQMLREVVVTGYSTQRKMSMTGSVSTVINGQMAGLTVMNIRGIGSVNAGKPLIVVDGIPVESIDGVDPAMIAEITTLKDAAATAIFGTRAANGVIVITTKGKKQVSLIKGSDTTQTGAEQSLRKNFADYAYWQPRLTTDAQGKASFTTTFPDDITNWRTFVIGINDNQQAGFSDSQIKSYKPLSANFIAPQFAIAGDEMNLIGKLLNYTTTAAKLTRIFKYNGQTLKQDELDVKNSKIDTLGITAATADSLTFEYTIKRDNGYFDGEQRKIPVMPQGVKETKGIFEALDRDTTVNMKFDPALGPVTFRAEASALPVLAEETRKLREYKYLCNEQLASKLKGLLMERHIKKFLGEDFKYGKNIQEVIKKLQENRRSNGTWGWWKDTNEELWISLHAIEALLNAQADGYAIELDKQKLSDYLVYQMESYHGQDKILCLQLLHKLGAKVDYQKYIIGIEKEQTKDQKNFDYKLSGYDKLRMMLLRQESALPINIDSLLSKTKHTMFGNIYWGEDGYRFFDNSVQLSVLAYRIIKNNGGRPELLNKIRGYFLEQRRLGDWRNTYESALILETILPDLLIENKQVKPSQITLTGTDTKTISKFPYSATLTDKTISISKTGSLPVYISGYQQFWNSKPEKVSKDFTVNTWFERKEKTVTTLKGGEPVLLKAEVTARGDADFVMIEIPIPAGCSYESKEQAWQNNEVHREYFKEKVSIFCRSLKQGKYIFTVNLIPRYNGKYTLNPAKAEMMYFPVFYGREGMKRIVIGE